MNRELNWSGCAAPALPRVKGRFVSVEPAVFPEAGEALFPALCGPGDDDLWTYIPIGPFARPSDFGEAMAAAIKAGGWKAHLFRDVRDGAPLGMASYMRIRPEAGSAEVGTIVFSKKLQRTPAATEAMYLMAKHIFDDLGYRRYEWKCNNANEPSKRAAARLGFSFEGIFRQDLVVKGRNRDTAWFSIIDKEWPAMRAAFETWLAPDNFDAGGKQRRRLQDVRGEVSPAP